MYLEALCTDFMEIYPQNDQPVITGRRNILEMKQHLIDAINFQTQIDEYVF